MGIIPRIISDVFDFMEAAPASSEFSIRVSYVEIYMERICDLLNPEVSRAVTEPSPVFIKLFY